MVTFIQSVVTVFVCVVVVISELREMSVSVLALALARLLFCRLSEAVLCIPLFHNFVCIASVRHLLLLSCCSTRCLRARAEKRFKKLATTPTTLAYMALRDTMGSKLKLKGGLSTIVKDMFSKIDLDNNGVLERDEIRCECLAVCVSVCVYDYFCR